MIESVQLTATEKEDVIRNVIGLVQRLYGEDLPDDFNVADTGSVKICKEIRYSSGCERTRDCGAECICEEVTERIMEGS